ncbi:MAG: ankyrin repeat domain-containing protein [Bacteroidota bacterium]
MQKVKIVGKGLFFCLMCCLVTVQWSKAQTSDAAFFQAIKSGDFERVAYMIEDGANVNAQDDRGFGVINYAVVIDELQILPLILNYGARYNSTEWVEFPLFTAIRRGDYKHVMMLIQQGSRLDMVDPEEGNAVFIATRGNNLEVLNQLLAKKVPTIDDKGQTALQLAAIHGADRCIPALIGTGGLPPNMQDSLRRTPLHLAAAANQAAACTALLKAGAEINATDYQGRTPMSLAAAAGASEAARVLISDPKYRNMPTPLHGFPLHEAARGGHIDIVEMLLARRADQNLPDGQGYTPLQLATHGGHARLATLFVRNGAALVGMPPELVAMLRDDKDGYASVIKSAASANKEYAGMPYLYWALEAGREVAAVHLLANGAKVDAKPSVPKGHEATPIHTAAAYNCAAALKQLIGKGANLDAIDGNGETPLLRAARLERLGTAQLLVQAGADLTVQGPDGETAIHLAAKSQRLWEALFAKLNPKDLPALKNARGETLLHTAAAAGEAQIVSNLLAIEFDLKATDMAGNTPLHAAAAAGQERTVRLLLEKGASVEATNIAGQTAADSADLAWEFKLAKILR